MQYFSKVMTAFRLILFESFNMRPEKEISWHFRRTYFFCAIFWFRNTRFEQSNSRNFDLIAFLRRSKIISSGCLPRNCRMTLNSSLQMAKKRKNHRFAVKPLKLPEGRLRSHLRGECFRTIAVLFLEGSDKDTIKREDQ